VIIITRTASLKHSAGTAQLFLNPFTIQSLIRKQAAREEEYTIGNRRGMLVPYVLIFMRIMNKIMKFTMLFPDGVYVDGSGSAMGGRG